EHPPVADARAGQCRQPVKLELAVASKRQAGGSPDPNDSGRLSIVAQLVMLVLRFMAPPLLNWWTAVWAPAAANYVRARCCPPNTMPPTRATQPNSTVLPGWPTC